MSFSDISSMENIQVAKLLIQNANACTTENQLPLFGFSKDEQRALKHSPDPKAVKDLTRTRYIEIAKAVHPDKNSEATEQDRLVFTEAFSLLDSAYKSINTKDVLPTFAEDEDCLRFKKKGAFSTFSRPLNGPTTAPDINELVGSTKSVALTELDDPFLRLFQRGTLPEANDIESIIALKERLLRTTPIRYLPIQESFFEWLDAQLFFLYLKASKIAEASRLKIYTEYQETSANKEIWFFYKNNQLLKSFRAAYLGTSSPRLPSRLDASTKTLESEPSSCLTPAPEKSISVMPISTCLLLNYQGKQHFLPPLFEDHQRNLAVLIYGETHKKKGIFDETLCIRAEKLYSYGWVESCKRISLNSSSQNCLFENLEPSSFKAIIRPDDHIYRHLFQDDEHAYYLLNPGHPRPAVAVTSVSDGHIVNVFLRDFDSTDLILPQDFKITSVLDIDTTVRVEGFSFAEQKIFSVQFSILSHSILENYNVSSLKQSVIRLEGDHSLREDPGFYIAGQEIKHPSEIDSILKIKEKTIEEIERLMKTPDEKYSVCCFLNPEDDLKTVWKEDWITCKRYGIGNREIADLLGKIEAHYEHNNGDINIFGTQYKIVNTFAINQEETEKHPYSTGWAHPVTNILLSPFDDQSLPGRDLYLFNAKTKEPCFGFSTVLISLIRDYGFFERGWYHFNIENFMNTLFPPLLPRDLELKKTSSPRVASLMLEASTVSTAGAGAGAGTLGL